MEKRECLSIILTNSVQGNKKMVESLQNMIGKPINMFKNIWQWRYLDYKIWRDVPVSSSFFILIFSLFFLGGVSKTHPVVVYHVTIDLQVAVTHNKFY